MALKATIFKAELQIADMDRQYYSNHSLTIARHPSENDQRMMLRVLDFALHAQENLVFCKGVSTDDEPDLWQKSLSDEIKLWIDLGQPEEKRIRKACGRADEVIIYAYQPRSAPIWWNQQKDKLQRFENLSVYLLHVDEKEGLSGLVQRSMNLQATVQDGQLWLVDGNASVQVTIDVLKKAVM